MVEKDSCCHDNQGKQLQQLKYLQNCKPK